MDLQHLRASDGTGEAVLAHIQSVRNPGSTVLDLDNVDNWNSKVIVVTGTPAANGYIAAAGMKVMYGHITAGDLVIDGFAPGYTDNGNTTSEVAIVKMTTSWADTLVNLLGISLQDNGKLKTTSLDDFFKPSELTQNFVASGGIVTAVGGLQASFTAAVVYVNGLRYTVPLVAARTYTASKDTYVDVLISGGVASIVYTEAANGGANPALAANSVRIARVVTSGAAVTSVVQNQPDANGVWIRPDKPNFNDLDTGWINVTFQNSFVAQNALAVSYRRIGKLVKMRGQPGKATLDANVMFNTPFGFRPTQVFAHTVPGSSANLAKLSVAAGDGVVNLVSPSGGTYMSLDGVTFTVD